MTRIAATARSLAAAAMAALALGAGGCAKGSTTPAPTVEVPVAGTGNLAPTLDGRLRAPSGLAVSYFAKVPGARSLAVAPDGSVYVSQPGSSQVTRLVDANGDGVAEQQTVAVRGLDDPFGLAFHDGWLYVANTGAVVRVRLDANGVAAGAPQELARYGSGGGHSSRSIAFGQDGTMFITVGSTCNLCEERDSTRAAVLRFDADGTRGRVYARGLRNAVGIAVNPATGALWVSTHERDNIEPSHENLPPEEIDIVREGGDYGWPYCHSDRVPNPEYDDAARCQRTVAPALKMQAHSAPMMLAFLAQATALPAEYRGDALLAFHGSWNRSEPTGAKLVRVRIENGTPVGYEDFVTGWQNADGSRWGRPVGVAVARDGAVLVTDDAGGAVYRIAAAK